MIDRESDGRFVASIPDLGDLAAYGDTDKDAVAHVTDLAAERVRAAVDDGQPVPPRRHSSEMPSHIRSNEVGRAIIPRFPASDFDRAVAALIGDGRAPGQSPAKGPQASGS
jgi:predicted RNase H-like HicB family nuclease